jgi:cyanate permease
LTDAEQIEVERRLQEDSGLNESFDIKFFFDALMDWKIWTHMFLTIGILTPLYSIALFLPTIVKGMGYSSNSAQLMTVPPYVIACVFTIAGSYFADKAGQRGVFLLGFEAVALAGFLMLVSTSKPHIQYGGTFLATSGKVKCHPPKDSAHY